MKIELLAEHLDSIPELTRWYQAEWEPYYGNDGPGDARADLQSRGNRDRLPIGLVAVENTQVVGTAALDLDVTTDLTPSIVGLLVGSDYRRRGIATALIKNAEDVAHKLGHERLYVSTSVLGPMLINLGWVAMDEVRFLNAQQGSIYMRELANS